MQDRAKIFLARKLNDDSQCRSNLWTLLELVLPNDEKSLHLWIELNFKHAYALTCQMHTSVKPFVMKFSFRYFRKKILTKNSKNRVEGMISYSCIKSLFKVNLKTKIWNILLIQDKLFCTVAHLTSTRTCLYLTKQAIHTDLQQNIQSIHSNTWQG